jgi:hypothetical protein
MRSAEFAPAANLVLRKMRAYIALGGFYRPSEDALAPWGLPGYIGVPLAGG